LDKLLNVPNRLGKLGGYNFRELRKDSGNLKSNKKLINKLFAEMEFSRLNILCAHIKESNATLLVGWPLTVKAGVPDFSWSKHTQTAKI
jgi:hypothetical protein